ncbi:bifunctional diaminohydroxyphosphoribosylaminopyrimidine deaminase/5-amino-6-(5-phosphoribosylamino)uracil reductase RibD [Nostoc ellipsosporum NOK]|nr:bifunctional diaminohydroxyphosphoribosylaminopyrimidine deaminase/5-amino-6-(5-phosphoribosylamino)uracil reductase RibD [Nostoc ellipsosporum NOK]
MQLLPVTSWDKLNSFTFALVNKFPSHTDEQWMYRCLQLAAFGAGKVAPNPMVGAVLVHNNRIIGEGYHQRYGQGHAEVNCIASVKPEDEKLIAESVMYVSLEPCAHFGKTPPCADLIIRHAIPKVVIGCRDSFEEVNGKGIGKLKKAGVEVTEGVLQNECIELNRRFFTYHSQQRPYVILKWAQTANKKIGAKDGRLLISGEMSNRLVHKWRSEEAAILVGTQTAASDDPALTTRLWPGLSPTRVVLDRQLRLDTGLQVFNNAVPTIVLNESRSSQEGQTHYLQMVPGENLAQRILKTLHGESIQSVLIEGGRQTLDTFIKAGYWDEIRIIENTRLIAGDISAPELPDCRLAEEITLGDDVIRIYRPQTTTNQTA